ncbi:MAG: cupin domain-containing protein [Actinomycetota bacterium]|nr:cupin domain-containing protein [Actinomycetota bacterium]
MTRDQMTHPNVFSDDCEYDGSDPDGYRSALARVGLGAGGRENTVKVYEIPPGQSVCPYHYEYVEEWLLVLDGEVELRTPAGAQALAAGALVCFPPGPDGAHQVTNRGPGSVRAMMFSSAREPAVAVYPDSDKVGVWPGRDEDELMLRRSDGQVDYWDGEA